MRFNTSATDKTNSKSILSNLWLMILEYEPKMRDHRTFIMTEGSAKFNPKKNFSDKDLSTSKVKAGS